MKFKHITRKEIETIIKSHRVSRIFVWQKLYISFPFWITRTITKKKSSKNGTKIDVVWGSESGGPQTESGVATKKTEQHPPGHGRNDFCRKNWFKTFLCSVLFLPNYFGTNECTKRFDVYYFINCLVVVVAAACVFFLPMLNASGVWCLRYCR